MTRVLCERMECQHNKRGKCTAPEVEVVVMQVPDRISIDARFHDVLGVCCPGDGADEEEARP